MPRKGYTPEQIINKLREAEVLISQGSTSQSSVKRLESATTLITAGAKNTAGCELTRHTGLKNWNKKIPV